MLKNKIILLAAFITTSLTVLIPSTTQAQLKITEVQSSEAGSGHGDWWELSNLGGSSVMLSGYKFDDNSSNITLAVSIPTITLAAGESAVFAESTTFAAFTNWWGITAPIQVDIYSGSGVSLGASAPGDQVNIWDGSGNLVDYVWFGASTSGHTFDEFDPITHQGTHQSVAGVDDAFTSADGNVGSPGLLVPEPSTFALAAFGAIALAKFRARKK